MAHPRAPRSHRVIVACIEFGDPMVHGDYSHCHRNLVQRELLTALESLDLPEDPKAYATRLKAEKQALQMLTKKIQEYERMHWYNALKKRIPGPLLNQPGTGCFIQKKAKAPGASTLFWLRYDEQEHLRRHRSLRHWAIACPCCSHPQDYSNVHALFHCTADRIPRASKQDYEEARTHLKAYWDSFFIEGLPEAPSEAPSGLLPRLNTFNGSRDPTQHTTRTLLEGQWSVSPKPRLIGSPSPRRHFIRFDENSNLRSRLNAHPRLLLHGPGEDAQPMRTKFSLSNASTNAGTLTN